MLIQTSVICRSAVGLMALLLIPTVYGTTVTINGFGVGIATVRVWCGPAAPPGPPTASLTVTGIQPSAALGPGLPGCNPGTQGAASGGILWETNNKAIAAGGDSVDDHDLLGLVTATSTFAQTLVTTAGSKISSSSEKFTVSWPGTDAGTAAHLAWYDGAIKLDEALRVGAWSETITRFITSAGSIDDVELRISTIALSVPAPGGAFLLAIAIDLACCGRRRAF